MIVYLDSVAKGFVRKGIYSTRFRHACGFQVESRKVSRHGCCAHGNGRARKSNEW